MNSRTNEEVNGLSTALQHATNLRTREQWLYAVLYGGRCSRIGQHLALVIYHLADTTTNIAKLSARDLERITGWSRTAIIEHLNELHKLGEFLRVQWGQGRAKSIFELQGIITEVMQQKKAERDAAATAATSPSVQEAAGRADTTVAANPATTVCVSQAAAQVVTTACGNPIGNRSVSHADTKGQLGGTIGGESTSNENLSHSLTLSARARENATAPDWMISEDGGFEGQVFELTGVEVGALQTAYTYLEFPADLISVDQFLARQFSQAEVAPSAKDRLARMHTYLAKRNREARELRLRMGIINKPEPAQKRTVEPIEPPSCWFDDDARLQVANGFHTEMLAAVGGNELRLREALDEAAGWVGVQVRGPQLMAKVRSQITKQMKGRAAARGSSGLSRSGIGDRDELTKALRRIEAEEISNKSEGGRYGD